MLVFPANSPKHEVRQLIIMQDKEKQQIYIREALTRKCLDFLLIKSKKLLKH